jgi:hypothetical protein
MIKYLNYVGILCAIGIMLIWAYEDWQGMEAERECARENNVYECVLVQRYMPVGFMDSELTKIEECL